MTLVEPTTFSNTWLRVYVYEHVQRQQFIRKDTRENFLGHKKDFIKSKTPTQVFPFEFCEMFKNTFPIKISGGCFC